MDNSKYTLIEDVATSYTKLLSIEAQLEALRAVIFAVAEKLETPGTLEVKTLKADFYDTWGESLSEKYNQMRVPLSMIDQVRNELDGELASIHGYMSDFV